MTNVAFDTMCSLFGPRVPQWWRRQQLVVVEGKEEVRSADVGRKTCLWAPWDSNRHWKVRVLTL
jgi:hypothetical protein